MTFPGMVVFGYDNQLLTCCALAGLDRTPFWSSCIMHFRKTPQMIKYVWSPTLRTELCTAVRLRGNKTSSQNRGLASHLIHNGPISNCEGIVQKYCLQKIKIKNDFRNV